MLGLGVGWMQDEFQYLVTGKVTDEYIQLHQELWTKENPELRGSTTRCPGPDSIPNRCRNPIGLRAL